MEPPGEVQKKRGGYTVYLGVKIIGFDKAGSRDRRTVL